MYDAVDALSATALLQFYASVKCQFLVYVYSTQSTDLRHVFIVDAFGPDSHLAKINLPVCLVVPMSTVHSTLQPPLDSTLVFLVSLL